MKKKRKKYRVIGVFDTETTNIGEGVETRAFPILYIDNDLRDVSLYNYTPGEKERINLYRSYSEYLTKINEYIEHGQFYNYIPIICAYNLTFDLQSIIYELSKKFDIVANAQSSTNVYTLDLFDKEDDKNPLLRFWDTFHLQMAGLDKMGAIAGLEKLKGAWDYTLIRTPKTELTVDEVRYAKRDVQVIPAYLKYLLHANEWLKSEMFGVRVITQTSLVRQMAKIKIGCVFIDKQNGKKLTLEKAFNSLCMQELPQTFEQYALRKACFRGGLTFTSAKYASVVVKNVISLDVTSMHHTFINGRYLPIKFEMRSSKVLNLACERVINTTLQYILNNYHKPFNHALHVLIEFNNVRLKEGGVFDKLGIATLAQAKFKNKINSDKMYNDDPRNVCQENIIREYGCYDKATNGCFAFSKLYSADKIQVYLTEVELWCFAQVYEFENFRVLAGEETIHFIKPPDYVTLQSNLLYNMKNAAKEINNNYMQGENYSKDVDVSIPNSIKNKLKNGSLTNQFFESWYINTVKGQFNGIYGTQAQDVYKPIYKCEEGELLIDETTKTTVHTWESKQPKSCKVLYNYGSRIVAGSRMHLIIAMVLLNQKFKDKIKILGGDTDSLKISCNPSVEDDELISALEPLKTSSVSAINKSMERVRSLYKDKASTLEGVGSFEVEKSYKGTRWNWHIELWNKGRISVSNNKCHVTLAGLSRPANRYNIENYINDLIQDGYNIEYILKNVCTYNTNVCNALCYALAGYKPKANERFEKTITDYKGVQAEVKTYQAQALYKIDRIIGDTAKLGNQQNIDFVKKFYNRDIDTSDRWIKKDNSKVTAYKLELCYITPIFEHYL